MKKNYFVNIKLSEELYRKIVYVSSAEGRSPNNQFVFMVKNNIAYFERTKGKISNSELQKIQLPEDDGER